MIYATWAQLFSSVFIGFIGVWMAYNYRRQIRLKLAERQVDAYKELWQITSIATPRKSRPLSADEREMLSDTLMKWYHGDGNGIFMPVKTRDLFLKYQGNLTCSITEIKPAVLADRLSALTIDKVDLCRGCVSKRHATYLRSQLKHDLLLHLGFVGHYRDLRFEDKEFLRSCGLSLKRRPWRRRFLQGKRVASYIPCVCGMCPPE